MIFNLKELFETQNYSKIIQKLCVIFYVEGITFLGDYSIFIISYLLGNLLLKSKKQKLYFHHIGRKLN
jgi:hypothetical protein